MYVSTRPIAYTFTIKDTSDYEHARALWLLCRRVLLPYMEKHEELFGEHAAHFARFLSVAHDASVRDLWGKTLHNTRHSFSMSAHHMRSYMQHDDQQQQPQPATTIVDDVSYLNKRQAKYATVPYTLGYTSHFRATIDRRFPKLSIRSVMPDLNYLNCHFRPVMRRLTQRDDL